MSRESTYQAIILKKQAYAEADEIITFFTLEHGKVRALAKSVKSPKSKLQQKLQALFLVQVILSHSKFPKIIAVEPVEVFAPLRDDLEAMKRAFYITELVLKFTPDEQKNEGLFILLREALDFLASKKEQNLLDLALAKFKIGILEVTGFGIHQANDFRSRPSAAAYELFLELKNADFNTLLNIKNPIKLDELQGLLSDSIEYQLERAVKSEKYLKHDVL